MAPKISIHLVTWNGEKYIADCLESIFRQTFDDYFLLIVDNGSIDETKTVIEQQYLPLFQDKARLIRNKDNAGFAKAHNQALLWTDSEYVLVLNQDIILEPDFLEQAVRFMDAHPKAGSINPKLLKWEGKTDAFTPGTKSTIIDSLGLELHKTQRVSEIGVGEEDGPQYAQEQEIFGASGAAPMYRRAALEDIRYNDEFFDADFMSYKEDIDVAYRLRWKGWESYFVPQAVAYHDRSAVGHKKIFSVADFKTRKKKASFVSYHSYKNHRLMLYKNLNTKLFLRYFFFVLPYECAKLIYILFMEPKTVKALSVIRRKKKIMKAKRKEIMGSRRITDAEMRKWFI